LLKQTNKEKNLKQKLRENRQTKNALNSLATFRVAQKSKPLNLFFKNRIKASI